MGVSSRSLLQLSANISLQIKTEKRDQKFFIPSNLLKIL